MKRLLIASALFAVGFAAQAQSAATVTVQDDATPGATSTEVVAGDTDQSELTDRTCLRETGSRIAARSNTRSARDRRNCISANGRSYSRDDIQSTGTTDLAEALRRLDPSIH